eukprot:661862-Pelagomonas_calceolata.AAC.2
MAGGEPSAGLSAVDCASMWCAWSEGHENKKKVLERGARAKFEANDGEIGEAGECFRDYMCVGHKQHRGSLRMHGAGR